MFGVSAWKMSKAASHCATDKWKHHLLHWQCWIRWHLKNKQREDEDVNIKTILALGNYFPLFVSVSIWQFNLLTRSKWGRGVTSAETVNGSDVQLKTESNFNNWKTFSVTY